MAQSQSVEKALLGDVESLLARWGRWMGTLRIGGIGSLAGCLVVACATSGPPAAPSRVEACRLFPGAVGRADKVTVALTHPVNASHAPYPRNPSEELVFRQLYGTLVQVDCMGGVSPGLAESWTAEDGGRRWTLTLRKDARFWDGSPVTAAAVLSSWRRGGETQRLGSTVGVPFETATAVSERVLTVVLHHAQPAPPRVFAHPCLAVAKTADEGSWPLGTGPYRVRPDEAPAANDAARALSLEPVAPGTGPALGFRLAAGVDPRDLLDEGVELLMTQDPALLDYAATRPGFVSHPLPWDRFLVLLSPRQAEATVEPETTPKEGPDEATPDEEKEALDELRRSLAREAVGGEAQGAEGPYWWQTAQDCRELKLPWRQRPGARPTSSPASTSGRIVYPQGDRDAQAVAERLVALAVRPRVSGTPFSKLMADLVGPLSPTGSREVRSTERRRRRQGEARPIPLRSAALTAEELNESLEEGNESAYVLPLPRSVLAPCHQVQELIHRAGWWVPRSLTRSLVPLVTTRPRAILKREIPGVRMDWDGTLLFSAGGREKKR